MCLLGRFLFDFFPKFSVHFTLYCLGGILCCETCTFNGSCIEHLGHNRRLRDTFRGVEGGFGISVICYNSLCLVTFSSFRQLST